MSEFKGRIAVGVTIATLAAIGLAVGFEAFTPSALQSSTIGQTTTSVSSPSSEYSANASQIINPPFNQWLYAMDNQSVTRVSEFYTNSSVLDLSGEVFAQCLPYRGPFSFNGTTQISQAYTYLFSNVLIPTNSPIYGELSLASISSFSANQSGSGMIDTSFTLVLSDHAPGNLASNATVSVHQSWFEQGGKQWAIQNETWNYLNSNNPKVSCAG